MDETADKPETTVQDRVSTFVSMELLDIFNRMSGYFPAVLVATKPDIFDNNRAIFSCVDRTVTKLFLFRPDHKHTVVTT